MRKPSVWVRRLEWQESEVPLLSQSPQHGAVAATVAVIDLDHPILVAERDQQIAIGRRVYNRIGVDPIDYIWIAWNRTDNRWNRWKTCAGIAKRGAAAEIQMVNGSPRPADPQHWTEH